MFGTTEDSPRMTSARPAIGVVEGPAAWLAADLEASTDWWRTFTEAEVGEIHAALEHLGALPGPGQELHLCQ